MLLLLFAIWKSVMRRGGNTYNKQSQLAMQHCCAQSCTKMLPVLLDLKRAMSQTDLVSHAGSVCRDPGINTPKHIYCVIRQGYDQRATNKTMNTKNYFWNFIVSRPTNQVQNQTTRKPCKPQI